MRCGGPLVSSHWKVISWLKEEGESGRGSWMEMVLIDKKQAFRFDGGTTRWLREHTPSRLPSSLPISLKRRAPRSCVEDIGAAISPGPLFSPTFVCQSTQPSSIQTSSSGQSMAPPLESWPAYQLPDRAQGNVKDKKRKNFNGNLKACELLELLQYECKVEPPVMRDSVVRCWPVVRLFRR